MALAVIQSQAVAPGVSGVPAQQSGGTPIQPGGTANTGGVPQGTILTNNMPAATSSSPVIPTSSGSTAAQQAAAATAAAQAAKISSLISSGIDSTNQGATGGIAQGISGIGSIGNNDQQTAYNTQAAINLARQQIGTTQINSIKQLQDTIKNGLYGEGVQLGNTGALGSSASDAVARAYAQYGNQQTNAANNTAATGNQAQDVQQLELVNAIGGDKDQLDQAMQADVTSVNAQAASALESLKTQIIYEGGDPNSVGSQAVQTQIAQQAQSQLAAIDQKYQAMLGNINPLTADQTAQAAEAASNAGVVPASQAPYNPVTAPGSTVATPAGAAPVPSLIPLTLGKPQDQTAGV